MRFLIVLTLHKRYEFEMKFYRHSINAFILSQTKSFFVCVQMYTSCCCNWIKNPIKVCSVFKSKQFFRLFHAFSFNWTHWGKWKNTTKKSMWTNTISYTLKLTCICFGYRPTNCVWSRNRLVYYGDYSIKLDFYGSSIEYIIK